MKSKLNFKKNKAVRVLGLYLLNKIQQKNEEELILTVLTNNYNYDDILIEETSKKIVLPKDIKTTKKMLNKIKNLVGADETPRNTELIFISLLKFSGFIKYIKFQGLSHEDIRRTACLVKHAFYPKGSYLFRKHDKADRLYGVIKGKISLRENKFIDLTRKIALENINNLYSNISEEDKANFDELKVKNEIDLEEKTISLTNFMSYDEDLSTKKSKPLSQEQLFADDNLEKEILTVSSGMCFGDWGLLYNIPRTASAYCLEDTHVFYLEKEYFDQILGIKFFKSDMAKINFILNKLPILKTDYKFRHLLTKITPIFYEKDQIVYTPFDKANTLYLIYQGECGIAYLPNAQSREDIELKKNKLKFLSSISVGGISGLECCNINANYDNTLIVTSEFTVLLKIDMKFICEKCKDFRSFLIPLYEDQKKINYNATQKIQTCITLKMSKVKDLFKIGIPNQKEMENTISHIRYRIKSAHDASIYNSRFRIKDKTTIVNTKKIEKNSHIQTNKKPTKEIISKYKVNRHIQSKISSATSRMSEKNSKSRAKHKSKASKDCVYSYINSLSTEQNTLRLSSGISYQRRSTKRRQTNSHQYSFLSSNSNYNCVNTVENKPIRCSGKFGGIIDSDILSTFSNLKSTYKTIYYDSGKYNLPFLTEVN